jgi:CII-binding regulator of phage lambda lysogenization HflD
MGITDHPADNPQAKYAHARARLEIEAIARELERPLAEVAEIYTELDSELRSRAQVTDFLPVLVARKVRARFQTPPEAASGA